MATKEGVMFNPRYLQFIAISLASVLVGSDTAAASCPGLTLSGPRIDWDLEIWTYSGPSFSNAGFYRAFNNWNAQQTQTTFCNLPDCPGNGVDIFISEDSSMTAMGEEQSFGNGSGQSGCYLHPSYTCSNMCFTEDKLYYATVKLNTALINSTAQSYSAFGVTVDDVVTFTVSHEIGHVFRLAEYTGSVDCASPTIMNVNEAFTCSPRFFVAQTCDANTVASLYSGWTVYSWATCGPICNQSLNCQ